MFEVDVTVTDIFMALECMYFSYVFYKDRTKHELFFWLFIFFGAVASASFFGAAYHGGGFLMQPSLIGDALWSGVFISSSIFALSLWMIGAFLVKPRARVSLWLKMLIIGFNVFVLLSGMRAFIFIIMIYIPGLLLLCYGLIRNFTKLKRHGFFLCCNAIILTVIASLLQYMHVGFYITHNALYHILLMIAYLLLFLGGKNVAGIFAQNG